MDSPPPLMPIPLPACLPLTPAREAELRAAVIAQARSWIGTPYHQQADVPGAGIDCAMLLVRAWVDAGIFQPFDPRPYPPNWHLHRSEERYLAWMQALAREVDAPQPGDVVIWRFGRCFSHGGIIVNAQMHVAHALADQRKCTLTELDDAFLRFDRATGTPRPRKFFDVFAAIRDLPA